MSIRLSKGNLTAHVTTKDDYRPALTAICFTQEGTVSTDGFRLLFVPYPKEQKDGAIETLPLSADYHPQVMIPARTLTNIAKALVGKNGEAELSVDAEGKPSIVTESCSVAVKPIEGAYPRYEQIIPEGEPVASVAVNVDFLIDVLRKLKRTGTKCVILDVYDKPCKPLVIRSYQDDAYAIVMSIDMDFKKQRQYLKASEKQRELGDIIGGDSKLEAMAE